MAERILLIDDEEIIRDIVTLTLQLDGYEVEAAAGAAEGLARATAQPPDLIMLDIMLPGMSGWQVFAELKRNPGTARVPVIIFTAKQNEMRHECAARADGILLKPYDTSVLLDMVAGLLRTTRNS